MPEQTINEKMASIASTVLSLEDEFVILGDLLSTIKGTKAWKNSGYEKWSEFVESEYGIASCFANKLIKVYKIFVNDMDKSDGELQEIGLEKLNLITTLFAKFEDAERIEKSEEWYENAMNNSLPELKQMVKAAKAEMKEFNPREELERQWKETWCELMDCSWKELRFKLALFFMEGYTSPEFVSGFKDRVRDLQKRFERAEPEMMRNQAAIEFAQGMQDICDRYGGSVEISTSLDPGNVLKFEPQAAGGR